MADAPSTVAGSSPAAEPATGVPIVDLTALIRSLYEEADRCRLNALHAERLAAAQRRQVDLLEQLAAALSGGHR